MSEFLRYPLSFRCMIIYFDFSNPPMVRVEFIGVLIGAQRVNRLVWVEDVTVLCITAEIVNAINV